MNNDWIEFRILGIGSTHVGLIDSICLKYTSIVCAKQHLVAQYQAVPTYIVYIHVPLLDIFCVMMQVIMHWYRRSPSPGRREMAHALQQSGERYSKIAQQ